ncbi:hypothetical protein MRX96_037832 [Rhipicephalus microplus]
MAPARQLYRGWAYGRGDEGAADASYTTQRSPASTDVDTGVRNTANTSIPEKNKKESTVRDDLYVLGPKAGTDGVARGRYLLRRPSSTSAWYAVEEDA